MDNKNESFINYISKHNPDAVAKISGSSEYPNLNGSTSFYNLEKGTLVIADISGLPHSDKKCSRGVFGFHIHEGTSCTGTTEDPFANAHSHYNPHNCLHPYHAGDLPPLFGNGGEAWTAFVTSEFTVSEIIGKTVIIHGSPDDFKTQPSGNSGKKIACGIIRRV